MSVKAKFYVTAITPNAGGAASTISMGAVCRGTTNAEWASATPCGSLTMTVRNEAAVAQFEVGREYYLSFEQAEPKPVEHDGHPYTFGTTSWGMDCCGICGQVGTWDGATRGYVWDDEAQAKHNATYGAVTG